jgi:pyruvate/2-oxoglutarate dehydrogenase complex dihydrolipoamide acyltransferase (E2) component
MKQVSIKMPQMGQSVAEGTIVRWLKRVGEPIEADEILVEIESDKISFQVESPAAGRILSCLKGEGDQAAVGEVIGLIESGDSAPVVGEPPAARPHAGDRGDQLLVAKAPVEDAPETVTLPEISRDWMSPYVLRLALVNNVSFAELQRIRGSGRSGRVTKIDLLQHLARRSAAPLAEAAGEAPTVVPPGGGQVLPMTSIRRTIADHLVQSIHTSAHVTMVHAVDMTHIVELRDQIRARFEQKYQVRMSYTAVMIFVAARVLRDYPTMNSSVVGSNILLRKEINIGCAVALSDESLVVPVVKNADVRSFPEVAQELDRLINLARHKELKRSDVEEGTFTISNFGAFGSLIGTPIINQPQVAILGMGAVFKAPVVVDGQIQVRDQVYLSFTFDHRVIDGAMGGRFLNAIQRSTEALTEESLDLAALSGSG